MSATLILRDVWASAAGMFETQANFEDIEQRIFFLAPMSGSIVGPPTSGPARGGDWAVNEMWIDSLHAVWLCTVAGTPGTWKQITAAVVQSMPTAPTGYEIIRDDLGRLRFVYNGSSWDRVNRKMFTQVSPATTWGPFTHGFGYVPGKVTVWISGREWIGGVEATTTTATITFDTARAGTVVIE